MPHWLEELLLESPVPESNWMPSRTERLADARDTLRRRFGEARERGGRPSHRLRDLGSAHPLFSGTRIVTGDQIEADLERDITSINPPVIQGWAVGLLVVVGAAMLIGLATLPGAQGSSVMVGLVGLALPPLAWGLVVLAWGTGQWVIKLDVDGVTVRRWSSAWLRRPGRGLGQPAQLRAALTDAFTVNIEGPQGGVRVGLRLWPPSARADLVDELPLWGVDCDFGRHRHHHAKRGRNLR